MGYDDEVKVMEIDHYKGIAINEYQGKISICEMQKGQNDVWYKSWCYWTKRSNGETTPGKMVPKAVLIGEDRTEAIVNLEALLADLKGENVEANKEDDIPF